MIRKEDLEVNRIGHLAAEIETLLSKNVDIHCAVALAQVLITNCPLDKAGFLNAMAVAWDAYRDEEETVDAN